jgi:gliding motility-associated-like protein
MTPGIKSKATLTFASMALFLCVHAQLSSITPVLLGSGGGYSTGSTLTVSYSLGEIAVNTLNGTSQILTQGFQQPSGSASVGLVVSVLSTDLTCKGAGDGTATATITSGSFPFSYSWHTIPSQSSQIATGLMPGVYAVTVTDANHFSVVDSVLVKDNLSICGIHVYTGISPNGDGKNDVWIIDNIELFLPNSVEIFNRWGDKVWNISNYNNSGNVWKGKDNSGSDLPDGTYFYLLRVGTNEQKGWVEITR